jgi:hypothetical protein
MPDNSGSTRGLGNYDFTTATPLFVAELLLITQQRPWSSFKHCLSHGWSLIRWKF